MEDGRDRLRICTADIRTTWIVTGVLLVVLVLFSGSFGHKAYHDTGNLEESLYTAFVAALFALPFIAIGVLFLALSLRPLVLQAGGRWFDTTFAHHNRSKQKARREHLSGLHVWLRMPGKPERQQWTDTIQFGSCHPESDRTPLYPQNIRRR